MALLISSTLQVSLPASGSLTVLKRKANGDSLTRSLLCIVDENNPNFGTFLEGIFLPVLLGLLFALHIHSRNQERFDWDWHHDMTATRLQIQSLQLLPSLRLHWTSSQISHKRHRPQNLTSGHIE